MLHILLLVLFAGRPLHVVMLWVRAWDQELILGLDLLLSLDLTLEVTPCLSTLIPSPMI